MKKIPRLIINKSKNASIPSTERSGVAEGKTGGLARLFLCVGCKFVGAAAATSGSNSQADTLSGRKIDAGSSH